MQAYIITLCASAALFTSFPSFARPIEEQERVKIIEHESCSQEEQEELQRMQTIIRKTINTVNEITEILQNIKDKQSADAAAPVIRERMAIIKEMAAQISNFSAPTAEIQAKVQKEFASAYPEAAQRLTTAVKSVVSEHQCYGSELLLEVLN